MADFVYLDNNATTRVDERVIEALLPFYRERWGNPSSSHRFGAQLVADIDHARAYVAAAINARPDEIVFMSGGTEADNTAVRGALAAQPGKRHVVISTVEHHALIDLAKALEAEGVAVTRVGVDGAGRLNLDELDRAIRPDTAVVSLMLANNETGVIFPIREAAKVAARHGAIVHTDAVNALGKTPIDVRELGVAMLSLSGHKIYAPKGVGALYIRGGAPFRSMMLGGHQERDRRGGTQNVAGIVALGRACELITESAIAHNAHILRLRERLERDLSACFPQVVIAGQDAARLPNTTCACFRDVEAQAILLMLSESGICVSSGAACASGAVTPSHVLTAMGLPAEVASSQIRFSLGRYSTDADLDRLFAVLPDVVRRAAAVA
ncbi:MAG: aminotransferase class V-fold PLP-dependent enzyme [Phycisphaerales bacterium]|nr:aminotransferase class V-fold PLP-dependent enzyme [Phycisphaerales bacterium]